MATALISILLASAASLGSAPYSPDPVYEREMALCQQSLRSTELGDEHFLTNYGKAHRLGFDEIEAVLRLCRAFIQGANYGFDQAVNSGGIIPVEKKAEGPKAAGEVCNDPLCDEASAIQEAKDAIAKADNESATVP